jgi:hypothetical protein
MAGTRRDRGFVIHFTTYVAVNLSLLLINLFVDRAHFWFFWPLVGWGLGLLGHIYIIARSRHSTR